MPAPGAPGRCIAGEAYLTRVPHGGYLAENIRKLSVPLVEPVTFGVTHIKTVVCELRFPALLELERKKLSEFQAPLRNAYPLYDRQRSIDVSPIEVGPGEVAHLFASRDKQWTVSVKHVAIGLETSHYTSFKEFEDRLRQIVKLSPPLIHSDFYTRVGIRYVNVIPVRELPLTHFINRDLVAPLSDGIFGTVGKYIQEVRGNAQHGSYTLRHGFADDAGEGSPHYMLDFDFYDGNVSASDLIDRVKSFRAESFSFFIWCLGGGLRDTMYASVKQ